MGKWFIPEKYLGENKVIRYAEGPVYVITVNVIEALIKGIDSFTGYVINVEDVFITGILAQKEDIPRKSFYPLYPVYSCKKECLLFKHPSAWPCSIKQLTERWAEFENKTFGPCSAFIEG